jgi:protein-L-isoaspartate O-methyltransferase
MTLMPTEPDTFLQAWQTSLADSTFIRVTLGKPVAKTGAQKLVLTPLVVRDATQLRAVASHATKDITSTLTFADALEQTRAQLGHAFKSATLFTTEHDLALLFNRRGEPRLIRSKPSMTSAAPATHNRVKDYIVDPARPYLKDLGVTLDDGRVKPSMYAKFKQICHFIEIADDLIRESDCRDAQTLTVVDIGAGKGYLTFALYDYLTAKLGKCAHVTGIEVRAELAAFCNGVANSRGFDGLVFEAAAASAAKAKPVDIIIALHACDTATDDAIFQGIAGNASLIITAPCCQHDLAPQLTRSGAAIAGLMKFGLFKQRQADLITDAARCLLLEASGYQVKVIEFVSTEHTAKNILIAGIRSASVDRAAARRQYDALKAFAGFKTQHLEKLLAEPKSDHQV